MAQRKRTGRRAAPAPAPVAVEPEASGEGKADRTRRLILDAAIEIMGREGYQAATMRAIAARAGVSLGNAYYYFASKEHLVQAFYERTHVEHRQACTTILAGSGSLADRLRAVLRAHAATMAPHHRFAASLFGSAADPASPLNPFGKESRDVRERAIALFGEVVEGATDRVPDDLAPDLPRLLWLLHLGVVLFWLHDRSAGRRRTLALIDGTCRLVGSALLVASLPFTGPLRRQALSVLHDAWGPA